MLGRFKDWLAANYPFLFRETMPVWLTIMVSTFAAGIAAGGTYWLAPAINRQYQIDETRSAHIAKTTETLNAEIILLSQKVRRLNDALANNGSDSDALRQDCLDQVTKLQWMLVDLDVILKSDDDKAALRDLSSAINSVRKALSVSIDARAEPVLLSAMDELGKRTRGVLNRLYVVSSLK